MFNEYFEGPEGLCFVVNVEHVPWSKLGEIEVSSAGLWVGDPCGLGYAGEGSLVELLPGTYDVLRKFVMMDKAQLNVRARCVRQGSNPSLGTSLFEVGVDTAMLAIADFARASMLTQDSEEERVRLMGVGAGAVVFFNQKDNPWSAATIETGGGDGSFPIHALIEADRTVGIEAIFIEDGVDLVPYE